MTAWSGHFEATWRTEPCFRFLSRLARRARSVVSLFVTWRHLYALWRHLFAVFRLNDDRTVVAVINQYDHCRVTSYDVSGDVISAFRKLSNTLAVRLLFFSFCRSMLVHDVISAVASIERTETRLRRWIYVERQIRFLEHLSVQAGHLHGGQAHHEITERLQSTTHSICYFLSLILSRISLKSVF